jgi:hypothetical protein
MDCGIISSAGQNYLITGGPHIDNKISNPYYEGIEYDVKIEGDIIKIKSKAENGENIELDLNKLVSGLPADRAFKLKLSLKQLPAEVLVDMSHEARFVEYDSYFKKDMKSDAVGVYNSNWDGIAFRGSPSLLKTIVHELGHAMDFMAVECFWGLGYKNFTLDTFAKSGTAYETFEQEMADYIWVQASTLVMGEKDSLPEANDAAMLASAITNRGHSFDVCDDYMVYIKAFTKMHVINPTDELYGSQVYTMDIIANRISTNLVDGRVSITVEYENTLFRVYIDDIVIPKAEHSESEFIYKLRTTGTLKYYTDNPINRNFGLNNCHYFNSEFDQFTDDEIQVEIVDTKFACRSEYNKETKVYESVKPTMFAAIRPTDPAYYGDTSYNLFFKGKPIWVDYSILEAKLVGNKK